MRKPPLAKPRASIAPTMAATEDGASEGIKEVSAMDASAPPPARLSLTLKVHEIAKDAQNQNGLRHGDYHQYRQYCTRRLKRVRSSRQVRFMFGKGKSFVQKVGSPLLFKVACVKQVCLMRQENKGCCPREAARAVPAAPPPCHPSTLTLLESCMVPASGIPRGEQALS